ncbi:MAG: hypothetical protein IKW37_01175 [Bacteroidaceae bacterium]|nr:hypothetical protein [Bacteroidaceae bacterium]
MSKSNDFKSRLEGLQKDKEAIKSNPGKVIGGIISQEQEAPDFAQIAEELQQRHAEEARSLNTGYVKDTIYIEENIYKAFNALCTERGMKKQLVNEALADFVQKKYKELHQKN